MIIIDLTLSNDVCFNFLIKHIFILRIPRKKINGFSLPDNIINDFSVDFDTPNQRSIKDCIQKSGLIYESEILSGIFKAEDEEDCSLSANYGLNKLVPGYFLILFICASRHSF